LPVAGSEGGGCSTGGGGCWVDGFGFGAGCGACCGGTRLAAGVTSKGTHPAPWNATSIQAVTCCPVTTAPCGPPAGTVKPMTTRVGRPSWRPMSPAAAAYCSPSPIQIFEPSRSASRPEPWPAREVAWSASPSLK
jgi:hypothetical protein